MHLSKIYSVGKVKLKIIWLVRIKSNNKTHTHNTKLRKYSWIINHSMNKDKNRLKIPKR